MRYANRQPVRFYRRLTELGLFRKKAAKRLGGFRCKRDLGEHQPRAFQMIIGEVQAHLAPRDYVVCLFEVDGSVVKLVHRAAECGAGKQARNKQPHLAGPAQAIHGGVEMLARASCIVFQATRSALVIPPGPTVRSGIVRRVNVPCERSRFPWLDEAA
jgi:hypothetical protein